MTYKLGVYKPMFRVASTYASEIMTNTSNQELEITS